MVPYRKPNGSLPDQEDGAAQVEPGGSRTWQHRHSPPKPQRLTRAFDRATAERVVVYRLDSNTLGVAVVVDGVWTAKPYRLTVLGARPQDLVCNCLAGQHDRTCKHLAAGIFARQHRVYAVQPVKPAVAGRDTQGMCRRRAPCAAWPRPTRCTRCSATPETATSVGPVGDTRMRAPWPAHGGGRR